MPMRIAFIDHSYHQKTQATEFLINLLKTKYELDVYWDESWKGVRNTNLKLIGEKGYHTVIFFQIVKHSLQKLRKLKGAEVVFIPMYDNSRSIPPYVWQEYADVKFINFSHTLHQKLVNLGLQSLYLKYYPATDQLPFHVTQHELKGFFWQRRNQFNWTHIRRLIGDAEFASFHLHNAADPIHHTFVAPGPIDRKRYNITVSEWFDNKEDYYSALEKANIFFAPRLFEGIGLAFLEALTMGKIVIAPDNPTMNEYITHAENGILYDPKKIKAIDFQDIEMISRNARAYMEEGRRRWEKDREKLFEFIETKGTKTTIEIPAKRGILRRIVSLLRKLLFRLQGSK